MLPRKRAFYITFATTTQAMAAEKFFTERALPGRLIPVPREITAGCGLAWMAQPDEQALLTAALREAELIWDKTYVL